MLDKQLVNNLSLLSPDAHLRIVSLRLVKVAFNNLEDERKDLVEEQRQTLLEATPNLEQTDKLIAQESFTVVVRKQLQQLWRDQVCHVGDFLFVLFGKLNESLNRQDYALN